MNFELQPTLSNDLLLVRPLVPQDFDALYAISSDPLLWEQHPNKERSQRDGFERWFVEAMASGGALTVVEQATGRVIGTSRYRAVPESPRAFEIGWTFIARSHWGGVYNSSLKRLMIDHAFRFVEYVFFYIHGKNYRSRRAVEKIGGQLITEIDGRVLNARSPEAVIYSINRPDLNPENVAP